MSFRAKEARRLADLYNGKNQIKIFPELHKTLRDIVLRITSAAGSGLYEVLYRTPNPLPEEALQAFREAGYNITLDGFTYVINWE